MSAVARANHGSFRMDPFRSHWKEGLAEERYDGRPVPIPLATTLSVSSIGYRALCTNALQANCYIRSYKSLQGQKMMGQSILQIACNTFQPLWLAIHNPSYRIKSYGGSAIDLICPRMS